MQVVTRVAGVCSQATVCVRRITRLLTCVTSGFIVPRSGLIVQGVSRVARVCVSRVQR